MSKKNCSNFPSQFVASSVSWYIIDIDINKKFLHPINKTSIVSAPKMTLEESRLVHFLKPDSQKLILTFGLWIDFWQIQKSVKKNAHQVVRKKADPTQFKVVNEFLDKLIKEGKRKLARKFNLSHRYIDDLISFNNKRLKEFVSDIYPKELTISETTESSSVASYLDLLFTRDENNNITTKLYDKRDALGFRIVNFSLYDKQYSISTNLRCLCISAHSLCPLLFKL